jgi:glutathione peroxidase-family protein
MIVNTASKCGLTPQYKLLQELYTKYKDKNLNELVIELKIKVILNYKRRKFKKF